MEENDKVGHPISFWLPVIPTKKEMTTLLCSIAVVGWNCALGLCSGPVLWTCAVGLCCGPVLWDCAVGLCCGPVLDLCWAQAVAYHDRSAWQSKATFPMVMKQKREKRRPGPIIPFADLWPKDSPFNSTSKGPTNSQKHHTGDRGFGNTQHPNYSNTFGWIRKKENLNWSVIRDWIDNQEFPNKNFGPNGYISEFYPAFKENKIASHCLIFFLSQFCLFPLLIIATISF